MKEGRNHPAVALLAGGVGGARLARGLAAVCPVEALTVVVNVGDDDEIHGLAVSPDLDTVVYTLAGIEGPEGWGIRDDTWSVMSHLGGLGADVRFRIGDRDMATNLLRTLRLRRGARLSEVTGELAAALGVAHRVTPVTDDPVPTRVRVASGEWLSFQEYFVLRGHTDEVTGLRFEGAGAASAAPGVVEAIGAADLVVIAPSNPPLSIWPVLAIPGVRDAVERARRVVAVSPLIAGRALKGPADRVMASLGLPPGTPGVEEAYAGLLDGLVIDPADSTELPGGTPRHPTDIRIADPARAAALGSYLLELA